MIEMYLFVCKILSIHSVEIKIKLYWNNKFKLVYFLGWTIRGEQGNISSNYETVSFSAVVTFSELYFCGKMYNEILNDSEFILKNINN